MLLPIVVTSGRYTEIRAEVESPSYGAGIAVPYEDYRAKCYTSGLKAGFIINTSL
jgi:hypothetical protein